MTNTRMPRDIRARERLQEAQRRETGAVADVLAAQDAIAKAGAHRQSLIERASARVNAAEAARAHAENVLVQISGIDRAALLLETPIRELRKRIGTIRPNPEGDGPDTGE